jgi:hypothetical protein
MKALKFFNYLFDHLAPLAVVCFARVAEALEGAAPRLFRPMYARANMGHPSREAGFVVCSRAALLTCSSQAFLPNLVPQPRAVVSDHSINSRLESPRVR